MNPQNGLRQVDLNRFLAAGLGASPAPASDDESGESSGTSENEAPTSEHDYFLLSMKAGSRTMATSNSSKDPPLSLKTL